MAANPALLRAEKIIKECGKTFQGDDDILLWQVICDLMEWSAATGLDFTASVKDARRHVWGKK